MVGWFWYGAFRVVATVGGEILRAVVKESAFMAVEKVAASYCDQECKNKRVEDLFEGYFVSKRWKEWPWIALKTSRSDHIRCLSVNGFLRSACSRTKPFLVQFVRLSTCG